MIHGAEADTTKGALGRWIAVLGLVLWMAPLDGLAGEGDRPGLTPGERRAVRKYFDLQTEEVDRLIRKGRFEKALNLAQALLTLAPGLGENQSLLKTLKNKAQDGLQAASTVRGEIFAPEGLREVGDRLVFRVVLTNLGTAPLEIDMGRKNRGKTPFSLRVVYEERGCLGGVLIQEWNSPIRGLTGTRVLDPGETWETEAVLDSGDRSPLNPTVRTYRLRGVIWPVGMKVGGRPVVRPIRLRGASVRVFPRGLGPLRRAPLETLMEGVEEEFGPKVVLAASFIPKADYLRACDVLVRGQEREFDNPAMGRVMRVALRALTGRADVPLESEKWRRWWPAHGEGIRSGAGSADGVPGEGEDREGEEAEEKRSNPFEE